MSTKQQKQQERAEAIAMLREILKPGDTVHTLVRHAARSGMSRSISAIVAQPADYQNTPGDTWEPVDISWMVARALGWTFDSKNGGVKVTGAGMDMGFHLVYTLARVLFGENSDTLAISSDAGYALTRRWL